MNLVPVILCGGAGSRLWPVSREHHPKIFIRLNDGQSLLQKSYLRGEVIPGIKESLIVTNKEFFFKVVEEINEAKNTQSKVSYIAEPFGRNTAAAIASALLHVMTAYGGDAYLLILTADHLVQDLDAFQKAVDRAILLADEQQLVTFGISPTSPHTGYSYIEAEDSKVLRFVEKPILSQAEEYLASGRFYWNSGMFLSTAKSMHAAMVEHCPDILEAVRLCLQQSPTSEFRGSTCLELDSEAFARVPENSIDHAVMEKCVNIAMVPCDMNWSDIGSWNALNELTETDPNGNRIEGEAFLHDVTNCYIKSENRVVGAVGIDNLLIVDTPDALLVANKSQAQDVKHIYSKLKHNQHDSYKLHRTVHRPWGTYTVLEQSDRFKIKRIEVKSGASLSLQMHHHRSEHWIVVSGMAKVTNGEKEFFVRVNESTYIPAGFKHRLENPGVLPLVMIEVQSGDYLGEDDIVRFEDNYGRVKIMDSEQSSLATNFTVKPLRPEHQIPLIALFADIATDDTARRFHPHAFTDEYATKITQYNGKDLYLGAFQGADLVGYGLLRGWDEDYTTPSLGIYLHPAARGKGLAVKFMHEMHQFAATKGAPSVRLKVYPDNLIALKLYRQLGYKFSSEEKGQLVGLITLR
ncbi:MAG: mannose-1-phosphate guanylyltransferase/mannose-6-phosphate isomerase [Legionella sp.]|nr:mannose-1-phosphate guanylyltransferase/mannose-6-phosphate isomerase [Legionella sp.]